MNRSDSNHLSSPSLVRAAGSLLSGDATVPPALLDDHELDELLLAGAELVRFEAQVACRYTLTDGDRRVAVVLSDGDDAERQHRRNSERDD